MTLWMVLLGALIGCGSSTPEPTQTEAPAAKARAKGKHKKKGKRRMKAKRRRKATQVAPVGAAGEVVGTLVLTKVEEPARRLAKTATNTAPGTATATTDAPPANGAAATPPEGTADASGTPMVTRTKAELELRWGTDGTATVGLGKVKGTCTEGEREPIGPEGKEKTPLWTVRCADGSRDIELYILQVGPRITVVREVPGATPEAPATFNPVKRIKLAQGATLKREG